MKKNDLWSSVVITWTCTCTHRHCTVYFTRPSAQVLALVFVLTASILLLVFILATSVLEPPLQTETCWRERSICHEDDEVETSEGDKRWGASSTAKG